MANTPLFIGLWITITLFNISACDDDIGLAFTHPPVDVVVERGQSLTWDCQASTNDSAAAGAAAGPVTYRWRHLPSGELLDSRHTHVLQNGSLYFRKVRKGRRTDEGGYQCLASSDNVGTIASGPVTLSVAALSHFSVTPSNISVTAGHTIHLPCEITGTPPPTIAWEKHRQPLPHDNHRYTVLTSGSLQIHAVVGSDAGPYRCVATSSAKSRTSDEGYVTVTADDGSSPSPPSFVVVPEAQSAPEGSPVLLECAATGLPQPTVTWAKDGAPVTIEPGSYDMVGQGSLRIATVTGPDAGVYTCTAGSPGNQEITASAKLTVTVPPVLTSSDPRIKLAMLTATTRIPCAFSGSPPPRVSWTRAGLPVAMTTVAMDYVSQEADGSLAISKTAMFDRGVYQCWGENEAGRAVANFRVDIKAVGPQPPSNLRGRAVSDSEIQLSWSWPAELPVLSFVVYYEAPNMTVKETVYGSEDDHTQVLTSLRPYANYSICMVAYTSYAASRRTPVIYVRTDESVPLVMPHINVSASARSVRVTWSPLTTAEAQGIVTSYQVTYRLKDDIFLTRLTVPGNTLEHTITDLEPDSVYEVKVYPGTSVGYLSDRKKWKWTAVRTSKLDPRGVPEPPDLVLEERGEGVIEARWSNPSPGAPRVTGYRLKYRRASQDWTELTTTGVNNIYAIPGLDPGTWYDVQLQAYNDQGDGPYVIKSYHTSEREPATAAADNPDQPLSDTPEPRLATNTSLAPSSPPAPPRDIRVEPQSAQSVLVSWGTPEGGGGGDVIAMYSVHYHVTEEKTSAFCNSNTTLTSILIEDLRPYTRYTFTVQALYRSGKGGFSDLYDCRTYPGLPSAPGSLNGRANSASSVFLEWRPPEEKNGVIIKYIIFYSMDKDQPDGVWWQKMENGSVNTASVEDLEANVLYYFKLSAATDAGQGPPTNVLPLETIIMDPNYESRMGIIIGVCIGAGCFIICVLIIVFRNRLCPPLPPPEPARPPPCHHGNGYCTPCQQTMTPQALMLASEQNYETAPMLDSKGGGGQLGGGLLPINGLQAAVMPNGEIRTFLVQECRSMDRNATPMVLQALMSNGHCSHLTSRDGSMDELDDRHSEVTNSDVIMSNMADTPCSDTGGGITQQAPGDNSQHAPGDHRNSQQMETSFALPPLLCSHAAATDNVCGCHDNIDDNNSHDVVNGNLGGTAIMDGSRPPPNSPLPVIM